MMKLTVLTFAAFVAAVGAFPFPFGNDPGPLPGPYTEYCIVDEESKYPPPKETQAPWFVIDLDKDPRHRWDEVAAHYKEEIKELIGAIKGLVYPIFHGYAVKVIDDLFPEWDNRLPQPYQDELRGIADVTGMNLGEVVLYNVFYELNAVCTSIVAEDAKGNMYHARNLDFGLFLGWDAEAHDWTVTQKLRKLIINLDWQKGGKTLFKSVNFAGYTGVFNGLKQNVFTVTANERYDFVDGGYRGLIDWLEGDDSEKWMTWLTRDVMEKAESFDEAVDMLSNEKVMSPVYFIVGGSKSGQGAIVTRSRETALNTLRMDDTKEFGWFLLQTNYDNWNNPLYLDDRRTPGKKCMQQLGRERVGFEGIFNVLSSKTNLNKLTTYTVLMECSTGRFETYIQSCKQPCYAW